MTGKEDFRTEIYKDYVGFKQWEAPSAINPQEIYEIEFQRLKVKGPLRILEIGYGKGEFLDWAKSKGHSIKGIEIIPELVEQARSKGHDVQMLSVMDLSGGRFNPAEFDVVVIFDVLEHLHVSEIIEVMKSIRLLLRPQGLLLARFPNGASPIGLIQQMRDLTHVTQLSPDRMEQLGRITGFKLNFSGNTARPMTQGKNPRWMRVILYTIRDFIEVTVGLLYYGGRVALDPNMTVIMQKQNDKNEH
ncbi:MAG: class I SAM-dependent methyltransferase [Bdellovibrionota bacterium]